MPDRHGHGNTGQEAEEVEDVSIPDTVFHTQISEAEVYNSLDA